MDITLTTASVAFLFGVISAKWAMELGYSQLSQMAMFVAGCFAGPLVLFILYTRFLYLRKKNGDSGTQFFGYPAKETENN